MGKPSIVAEGISKKFGLSLRSALKYGLLDSGRRLIGYKSDGSLREGEFWALDNISFSLDPGDALGVMGVNGSGKTTLLRILNGTYKPDRGKVMVRGRVGALIAAGAGFAPMLSGRENVFVNGALLGLSSRQVTNLLDEIVAFAELGPFIDLPVKNYSSGMFIRLGFAVAALSKPDILLMDEVLAVGDLNFQKKCFEYILHLKSQGTAIILVSHSPGAIWAVCNRGLFIDKGRVVIAGSTEDIIRAYDDQNSRNAMLAASAFDHAVEAHQPKAEDHNPSTLPNEYGHSRGGTGDIVCTKVRVISYQTSEEISEIDFGQPFTIEYAYEVRRPIKDPIFRSSIDAVHYKYVVSIDSYEQGYVWDTFEPGNYILRKHVKAQTLRPGCYRINTSVVTKNIGVHLFYWHSAASFVIRHPIQSFLYSNDKAIVFFPCSFEFEVGK